MEIVDTKQWKPKRSSIEQDKIITFLFYFFILK